VAAAGTGIRGVGRARATEESGSSVSSPVEEDKGGGGDRADPAGTQADPAQRLERRLEQRVAALGQRSGGGVQSVDGALIVAEWPAGDLFTGMARAACPPS
jgi:hypothetical protein